MITIRSSKDLSQPSLICIEAAVTTPRGTFTMSSNGPMIDPTSPFGGGLFGAMSWPHSRFQLTSDVSLEQQMFLPHNGSGAALSWKLCGGVIPARLVVRAFFSGCGPRNYRDVGFRLESEKHGGRLTWLPTVRGPRIIADTNGGYYDEPSRLSENGAPNFAEDESLIAPGSFEFQLSDHPSIIIFSSEGSAQTQRDQHLGAFLAGLMPNSRGPKSEFIAREREPESVGCLVEAA